MRDNQNPLSKQQLDGINKTFKNPFATFLGKSPPQWAFTGFIQSGSPSLAHVALGKISNDELKDDIPVVAVLDADTSKWPAAMAITAEAVALMFTDDLKRSKEKAKKRK